MLNEILWVFGLVCLIVAFICNDRIREPDAVRNHNIPHFVMAMSQFCVIAIAFVMHNLFASLVKEKLLEGWLDGAAEQFVATVLAFIINAGVALAARYFIADHALADLDQLVDTQMAFIMLFLYLVLEGITSLPYYFDEFPGTLLMIFLSGSLTSLVAATTGFTQGRKDVLALNLIFAGALLIQFVVNNSCSHCLYWNLKNASPGSSYFSGPQGLFNNKIGVGLEILLSPIDGDDANGLVGSCRKCTSLIMVPLSNVPIIRSLLPNSDDQLLEAEKMKLEAEVAELFTIAPNQDSNTMFGDLADWYIYLDNRTRTMDWNHFNAKVLKTLARKGHFDDESLNKTLASLLCSVASRVDHPDPNRFLANVMEGRFTGEKPLNMSAVALQSIMRGDILHRLGVSLCFMLRFVLLLQEDYTLETDPIKYTGRAVASSEEGMKSVDYTFALPFMVTPGFDQDVDDNGAGMKQTRAAMDIYTRFPFQDEPLYFDTREEYYAFYRWQLESTIKDEWYFPRWLFKTEKGPSFIDLQAKKEKFSNDHLALLDPTSDRTLGDRCFYGTGQRFLTPMKFPGDDDYEYLFPAGPKSYMSEQHREKFRITDKPNSEQLLNMIHRFYGAKKRGASGLSNPIDILWRKLAPLEMFRGRIIEIDFSVTASLPSRELFHSPGCILYLDPKTKLPMGIWEASRKRMFLPSEGRDWEHAKYYYRVTERAVLAFLHVIESHFGWSQSVATAAWQTLSGNHTLHTVLRPFTLKVHTTNWAAYHLLARNSSILTHGSGFHIEGVIAAFLTFFRDFDYSQPFPEALEARKLHTMKNFDPNSLPYYSQGLQLYNVHHHFVKEMLDMWYKTDEDVLQDHAVLRLWSHINTYGRNLDPCVCGMKSDLFYESNDVWPSFDTKRTCKDLLDLAGFSVKQQTTEMSRRQEWCKNVEPFDKVKAIRKLLEKSCKDANPKCGALYYDIHYQRLDMGMPELKTKEQLVNFLATFIWQVTAGHKFNSDNISYFADPDYSGVRMREFDNHGQLPTRIDIGSYIFGTSITTLTTVRCDPLLADWRQLYAHFNIKRNSTIAELKKMEKIHNDYKFRLVELAQEFFDENMARPVDRRSNTMNPCTHASSVSV